MMIADYEKFVKLVHKIAPDATLLRKWALVGGVSAQVTALEVARADGAAEKWIVRLHGAGDLADNPQIARDEFRLLNVLQGAGIPAPQPYFVEEAGEIFSTPCIVVEYLEGTTEIPPESVPDAVKQAADFLARLHQLDVSAHDLAFLPDRTALTAAKLRTPPTRLDESIGEGDIRAALVATGMPEQVNQTALLHGDFWVGNMIWREKQLVGVIDWEDAALCDPLADLGYSRLEILWTFGAESMRQFTADYLAANPIDAAHLPFWDLVAALRPAFNLSLWAEGDAAKEAVMRERLAWFVAQAVGSQRSAFGD